MDKFIKTLDAIDKTDYGLFEIGHSINCGAYEKHRHLSVEVMIVLGGQARHIVNGVEFDARAGDVFFLYPLMTHELRDMHNFDEAKIHCAPGFFTATVPELKTAKLLPLFVQPQEDSKDIPWVRLTAGEFSQARQIVTSMLEEYKEKRYGWQPIMRSSFCQLLVVFARASNRERETAEPLHRQLNATISFMENNFHHAIRLDALARRAGLSKSQFIRVFRKNYGTSPVDYLIDLRLEHARRRLLCCRKTIAEIAFECGFVDSNYFSRQFKKKLGISPQDYRNRQQ